MKSNTRDERRVYDKLSLLKTAGLAVALGLGTWLLAPILLPAKLPADFPKLPDLQSANASIREALRNADRQARRQPDSAEVVGKLGMSYHANLFLDQAARAYRIAARLAPRDYRWVYCQASLEEENGKETQRLPLLEQTVRLKPDHAPALLKLADAYFKLERLDEAAHYYEMAAGASGGSAGLQATFGVGRVAASRRDWRKVIEYMAPLARTYPYLQPPFELLQQAYSELGEARLAAEAQQSILVSKWKVVPPLDDPLNEQLADLSYSSTRLLKQAGLLSHLGYPDRAIQMARRAAQAEPGDADVRNFIARTLLSAHPEKPESLDEALTQLGECLRLRPDDVVPLWMFATDFFATPKPPAAVERLGALVRPYAGRTDAHFYLGMVADARGDIQEAVSQYRAAIENAPVDSGAYQKLGIVLDKAGEVDEAIACFHKAIQLSPSNAFARFHLGAALLQRGRDAEGVKELREVLRMKPDYAGAHFCIAFVSLYSKRPDEAIARFREGLRYQPDDPEAHYGLGSALFMQQKRAEAIAELREALRLRPSYREAQELLQRLQL
jgi:tetratricopeptide (TPR) repeat protein